MQYDRLTSETKLAELLKSLDKRIKSVETKGSGTIAWVDDSGVETIIGELPDGTTGILPFVNDIVPPPVASAPFASAGVGTITVAWDGFFVANAEKPADFQHLKVLGHKFSGGTYVLTAEVGMIREPLDAVYVGSDVAAIDETWDFSFISVDYNGNLSAESARSALVTQSSYSTDVIISDALSSLSTGVTGAQASADGKSTNYYEATAPTNVPVGKLQKGDTWFDTANGYRLKTWSGSVWQTTQDAALAQLTADSKGRTYTQDTVPPVEARLPQNLWIDTSAGPGLYVTKYWNGSAWTALKDKDAKAAQDTADAKGETIYSTTEPVAAKRLPQNLWVDTTGGINIHKRWDGSAWVVAADSRIASNAAAVTAVDSRVDSVSAVAQSKGITYTQNTVPPVEARLPQNIWIDTSLGLDKTVTKYWNGSAWTAVSEKAASDAKAVADAKGETIYSTAEPSVAQRLPQNLWVDTTGGINIHKRWDGSGWVVTVDSRIPSTAVAVTAADAKAQDALDTADSKAVVYTQNTVPPVEARLPQNLWIDTSLGANQSVTKYWNGSAWTPVVDKVATDASTVAATKTKTYFQSTSPGTTGNTTGDLWFDTANGNKAYVWNGAWTVAQDTSINKSLFGTFTTDIDNQSPNKWMYTRYDKGTAANTIPSYLDIVGIAGTSSLVADGTNLVTGVGENYIGHLRTIVNVVSSKTIAITATHDDGAQIYVDGVSVYSKNAYTPNAAISFAVSAGWHVIDVLWAEQVGGDGFYAISPTIGSQVTSMFAPVSLSSTTKAVADAQASATNAMNAQAYSLNASFDDWVGSFPTGYNFWNGTPVKETAIVRRAPNAMRFNVLDATAQHGVLFTSPLAHAPNLEFFTVEVDLYLVSGTLDGSGMILDWNGMTNNRTQINFASEISGAVTGKWYTVSKVLRRPTNATGTWSSMGGFLMGQWSGHGTGAAKNLIIDWFNVRPSTVEEILAFKAPADAQTKADTAQSNATTAAQQNTMLATAYSKNPSFDDWAGTLPDTYNTFGAIAPVKDTTNKRVGAHGMKFTVPGTEDAGIDFTAPLAHMPNLQYVTVEMEFMLLSGTLSGAGVLLDWIGLATPNRAFVKLTDLVASPTINKWHRVSAVVERRGGAGTWTATKGWLMANWNELGSKTAKTIVYDWLNVRPSTAEEILSYGTPASITTVTNLANAKGEVIYSTTTPAAGQQLSQNLWIDTNAGVNIPKRWNGSAWVAVTDKTATDAAAAASAAQGTANTAVTNASTAQTKADSAFTIANGKNTSYYQTTQPSGGTYILGDLWFDTDDNYKLSTYTGSVWQTTQDAIAAKTQAIAAAATDATTKADAAQTAAISAAATDATTKVATKNATYYQTAMPTGGTYKVGDLWFDTDDGNKIYAYNGTTFVSAQDAAISAAQGTANTALTSANGKNKVYYQTAMPTGGTYILGDTWFDTDDGNKIYVHNGTTFVASQDASIATAQSAANAAQTTANTANTTANSALTTANGKTKTYFQTAQPGTTGNTVGDTWFDTDDGNKVYVWNGSAWTVAQDAAITAAQTSANGKNTIFYQTAAPATTGRVTGDTWFDTDDGNKIYVWNGSAWTASQDAAIAAAQGTANTANTAANNAQTTANSKTKSFIQSTAPTATTTGDIWIDTANGNVIKTWEGSSWVTRADAAIAAAQTAANTAQTSANGKATVFYQTTAPGTTGRVTGDTWFDTANGYRISVWNGTAWTLSQDATIATAQNAANTAQTAANTAQTTANSKVKTFVVGTAPTATTTGDIWIDTANGNVIKVWDGSAWVNRADTAIAAAQTSANAAQTSANGKNRIYYQTAQPSGGTYITGDTWFDTDDGYKIYVYNGSTWVASQDAAIAAAQTSANTAQTTANTANTTANSKTKTFIQGTAPTATTTGDIWIDTANGNVLKTWEGAAWVSRADAAIATAQTAANTAQTSANGKNRIYYQTTMPSGGTYIAGDTWFDTDDGNKIYVHNGTTFTASQLGTSAIANLAITNAQIADATIQSAKIGSVDAGTITVGTLSANRIGADTITATHIASDSITSNELAAGSITAAKGQISNLAVGTAQIADTAITTAKIANLAVTNAQIADASIQSAKIAALDAGKITSGTIDANRIGANTITANKIFVGDLTNLAADGNFTDINKVNWVGSGTVMVSANEPNRLRVITAASGNNDQANNNVIQVTAGEQLYGEVWVYGETANVGAGGPNMHLVCVSNAGVTSWPSFQSLTRAAVSGQWVLLKGTITIPANTKTAKVELAVTYSADAVGNTYYFREVSVRRKATGNLIVDGAIQAGSAIIGTGAIGTAQIGNLSVGTAQIADTAITTAKIANLAVTDAQIASATITSAKIANLDAGKITTGTLDANRIGADTITATHIASDSITSNELAAGSITAAKGQISNLAVGTAQIADTAITTAKIANLAVTDAQIASATITSAKIANLDAAKITTGTLDANRIGADTITASHIASDAITANELAANSITAAKGQISDAAITTAKIADAQITTAKIANLAVTDAQIASATITSAKIANLDAGKITTGTLDANRIGANSLTASKIAVTDFNNLFDNGRFDLGADGLTGWNSGSGVVVTDANAASGKAMRIAGLTGSYPGHYQSRDIPCAPGEKIRVKGMVMRSATANSVPSVRTMFLNAAKAMIANSGMGATVPAADTWGPLNGVTTAPAGTAYVRLWVEYSGLTGSFGYVTDLEAYRMNAGELIVDGTITAGSAIIADAAIGNAKIADLNADKLTAGTVNAARLNAEDIRAKVIAATDINAVDIIAQGSITSASGVFGDISAASITSGTIAAGRIGANTIDATMITGTAIDGKTITGATVQTESTANRGIKLTSAELAGYDGAGVKNLSLTNAGVLTLKGAIESGSTITGATVTGGTVTGSTVQTETTANRGIKLTSTELAGFDGAGVKNFSLTSGGTLAIKGAIESGSTITGAIVTGSTVQTEATANRGIKLTSTELAGYDGVGVKNFSLTSGGTLAIKGAIQSGSTITGATLTGAGIETTVTAARGVKLASTGITTYDGSGNMTFKVDAATGLVEAPGLKANSITGDKIASQTITANNIKVADFTNLATIDEINGVTVSSYGQTQIVSGYNSLVTDSGSFFMFTDQRGPVPFKVGDKLYFEFTAKATAATTAQFAIWTYDLLGGNNSNVAATFNIGTTDTLVKGELSVTSIITNAKQFVLGLQTVANKGIQLKGVKVYKKYGGELIVDGAIDGKVITGATIQTEATASRGIKLTSTELAGFDGAGVKNFSLTAAGALTLKGDIQSGSTITGARLIGAGIETSATASSGVKIASTGITAYDAGNNLTFKVDAATGLVEAPGLKANSISSTMISATAIDGKTITGATIQTEVTADRGIKLTSTELAGYDGAGVKNLSLTSAGVLTLTGAIKSGSTIEGARITGTQGLETSTVALTGVKINNAGIKAYDGANNLTFSVDAATGLVKAPGLEANSIKSDMINAGAVTTNKMTTGTIDAGVIVSGSIKALQIGSKEITADKMVITSTDNVVPEGDFGANLIQWGGVSGAWSVDATGSQSAGTALKVVNDTSHQSRYNTKSIPVEAGSAYRVSCWVKSSVTIPTAGIGLKVRTTNTAGVQTVTTISSTAASASAANTWYKLAVTYTMPVGAVKAEFALFTETTLSTGTAWFDTFNATRAGDGTLIVDGAIDGKIITGSTIQTEATALRGLKLNSTGLFGYDSTGATTFSLSAATGKAILTGRILSGGPGEAGMGIIPAAESYNNTQAGIFITSNGSFPGGIGGMWVNDATTAQPERLQLRGHNNGDVEIAGQNLHVRAGSGRVGNFSNWALGDAGNGSNYLPNLLVAGPSTAYLRLANAPTSSSAANAIIAVTPEGVMYRSTSSIKYKADIKDWDASERALMLRPRSWVDRNPIDAAEPMARYYGYIAEEVAAIMPEFVTYDDFGDPESVTYDRMPSPATIAILKVARNRVKVLQDKVAALEARMTAAGI